MGDRRRRGRAGTGRALQCGDASGSDVVAQDVLRASGADHGDVDPCTRVDLLHAHADTWFALGAAPESPSAQMSRRAPRAGSSGPGSGGRSRAAGPAARRSATTTCFAVTSERFVTRSRKVKIGIEPPVGVAEPLCDREIGKGRRPAWVRGRIAFRVRALGSVPLGLGSRWRGGSSQRASLHARAPRDAERSPSPVQTARACRCTTPRPATRLRAGRRRSRSPGPRSGRAPARAWAPRSPRPVRLGAGSRRPAGAGSRRCRCHDVTGGRSRRS